MPFEITIQRTFCAAHALRLPGGVAEAVHGHNWQVSVTVARDDLDDLGLVVDFHDLERQLAAIVGHWDNRDLNAVEPFAAGRNPSAEHVALTIAERLVLPDPVRLAAVSVTEAPGCLATYRPGLSAEHADASGKMP